MRTLDHAKQRAREVRAVIGIASDRLLERLTAYIESQHQIELIPVPAAVIDEGRAEVSPFERALNYDERLEKRPAELLWVLAHELGHLTLHQRLTKPFAQPDPLLGSVYLNDGAAGLARYSRKAREEAEANAFANEFISPSLDVFDEWRRATEATTFTIAAQRGVPERIIRAQLAEALHQLLLDPEAERNSHREHGGTRGEDATRRQGDKGTRGQEEAKAEPVDDADTLAPDSSPVFPRDPGGLTPHKPVAADPRQLEAATFIGAPALVTAGPGTGKTATLVRRIEFLLSEQRALPQQFLVLTFSNDAANELRERIAARFGHSVAAEMEIATFHGFGLSFLHHHALSLSSDAAILDEIGQEELLTSILGELRCPNIINLRDPEDTVKRLARHINFLKDRVLATTQGDQPITPELFADEVARWQPDDDDEEKLKQKARELSEVFRVYERAKTSRPAVDFADLIALPIRVLAANVQLVAKAREKYRWVLVDEYQDVSRTVALLLQHLCGAENPPWVVGDLRQAIYRFRGAAPENVLRFTEDFPGGRVFELDTNYRSCAEVVEAANQLSTLMEATEFSEAEVDDATLELNERWRAGTELSSLSDPAVALARANADAAEYDGIAAQVKAWLDANIAAADIAVLARRNADVRNILLALGERGVKATTSGLITPEGAAGDLAAIVTFLDEPNASLPRIVYSLGRGRFDKEQLNKIVAQIRQGSDDKSPAGGLAGDLMRVMSEVRFTAETQRTQGIRREESTEKVESEESEERAKNRAENSLRNLSGLCVSAVKESSAATSSTLADPLSLLNDLHRLLNTLQPEFHSGDAFDLLCAFLFNGSDYLRRALNEPDIARRSLALSEIITSLSRAAGYRYSHAKLDPIQSRLSFAKWFRDNLSASKPVVKAPQSATSAVRVMTCHASKGLEFPCVIVAGQTLGSSHDEMWLPPSLQSSEEEERAQADALLFVGVTRAKRALVVSCAESSSGSERARSRNLTPLLERWQQRFNVPVIAWPKFVAEKEMIEMGSVWGGELKKNLAASSLDDATCAIRTYLENFAQLRFPEPDSSLYPQFFNSLRLTLRHVIERAHRDGSRIAEAEAAALFSEIFTLDEFNEHPHYPLYCETGVEYAMRFAREYAPEPRAVEILEIDKLLAFAEDHPKHKLLPLRADLLACYRDEAAVIHAILFRPESLKKNAAKNSPRELLWSGLKTSQRLAFLLLRDRVTELQPWVFSASDGVLYQYRWSARPSTMTTERDRLHERWQAITHKRFETKLNERACDRCTMRIVCPHWLDAV